MPTRQQDYIRSLYPQGKCIESLCELQSAKENDELLIVGNGPNLLQFDEVRRLLKNPKVDKSGTTGGLLLDTDFTFLFFEPYFVINEYEEPLLSPPDISVFVTKRAINSFTVQSLNCLKTNPKCILANPQFPSNHLGYAETVEHQEVIVPPWFFVNEASDRQILNCLKTYFTAGVAKDCILNFRGSVIRQLSLGFALEYDRIHVAGLNPSREGYWYSEYFLNPFDLGLAGPLYHELNNYCRILHHSIHQASLRGNSTNKRVYSISKQFEFTWSILFTICMLARSRRKRVEIIIYTDDPAVLLDMMALGMDKLDNIIIKERSSY